MKRLLIILFVIFLQHNSFAMTEFYKTVEQISDGKSYDCYLKLGIKIYDKNEINISGIAVNYYKDINGYVLTQQDFSTNNEVLNYINNVMIGKNLITFTIDIMGRSLNVSIKKLDYKKDWSLENSSIYAEVI